MDVLLEVASDEISLEGSRGCSLTKLWQLLDARLPISVVGEDLTCLPDPVKQQLWLLLKAPDTPYTFAISSGGPAAEAAAPVPQQVPKGKKGKKRKAEEDDLDAEEDLAAAAASRGIPVVNGQPLMCFMAPHLAEVPVDEVPDDLAAATQLNIHLVAPVAARLAALRVDDALISTYKLNQVMFSTLEMLGRERGTGHVQIDMCKALNAVPRNFFYVLKHLEVRNLVVRHKLLVPSKTKTGGWNLTSIVHHTRFMPTSMFGPHCVLQEGVHGGWQLPAEGGNVGVRDDTVQLRTVCNLMRTSGGEHQRVLESQLKQVCHFTGKSGHRQWRRLRNKLVKLGYIEMGHVDLQGKSHACVRLLRDYTGGALISAAQEARLAARKAGAGAQVYSEDEEEPESSGDDDAGADAAGDGEEEDGEGEGEGEEGENEGGTGTEGDVLTVETSFTRTVLTLLCSAGPKGLMTTELAAKLNMTAKSLVKRIADLVKRYALEVNYDVKKKAITNRIIAPARLIAAWREQNPSCLLPAASTSTLPAPGGLLALPAPTTADLLEDEEEEAEASSTQGRKRQRLADGSAAAVAEEPHPAPMQHDAAGNGQQPRAEAAAAAGAGDQMRFEDGHRGRLAAGAAASSLPQEPWAPVTVVAQQRLQVLKQHLAQHGFVLRKEVRRVLRHAGVEPDRPQGVTHRGVDFKTANRLLALMVQRGLAKDLVVNTVTTGVNNTRNDEVEGVVRPDLEVTEDVAQRIIAHSRELARLHHQDNTQKYREAREQAMAASKKRALPVALLGPVAGGRSERLLGACPAAADAMQLSHRDSLRPRRLRRGERLEPFRAVLVAPADAILGGGSASGGSGEEAEDAAENDAPRRAAAAPGPDAWAGVVPDRPTAAEEVLHKRRVKRQLDREEDVARYAMLGYNGYIHTRMVRARVLHKYLCKVAGLAGNPPFTAPQLASPESQAQQVGQPATQNRTSTGAAGRPAVLPGSVAGSFRLLNIPLQSSLNAAAAASGARAGAASNAAAAAGSGGALHVKASGDGVVLLVSDIWSYMPIELALQVVGSCQDAGAAFIAAVEAERLVGQLSREEVRALWDTKYRHRLQTTLNVLARLGLVTSMDSESILVSSTIRAELPQMPPQAAQPKEYNLAGDGGGQQLQQYWKDLQAAYTNELIPLDVKSRCFPGSQTTDIMKASAWVDPESEQLPMLGYLKVQAHLSGVPVSSMSAILADQLAMDLGLPYAQVHKVVANRRQKINQMRIRQGKPKIAITGEHKHRRPSRKGGRKRKQRSRRGRRQSQGEGADTELTGASGEDGGSSSGSDTDNESDAVDEAAALRRLDRRASRTSGRARGIPVVVVSVLPPAPSQAAAAATVSGVPPAAAEAAAVEEGGRGSSSPVPQGQQEAAAALRVLQAVDQQVEEGDPERLQDVDALDQYGTLLPGEGGGDQASRRSTPGPGGDDNAADVQTSDEEGGNDVTVPVRVNRRRIKWRHQMDQELLRVVLLQRAEVGFHTKQFWSRLKGLPASCSACHKRYKLLQRKLPEAMQQLEGQTLNIHNMLVERRRALQQRLYALPAAHVWTRRPHGIEPTSVKRAVLAARHQQVQQEAAQDGSAAASQSPAAGADAEVEAAGGVGEAAAKGAAGAASGAGQTQGLPSLHEALETVDQLLAAGQLDLAAGGPVLVTPGGNVVLLPSAEEQALLDQLQDDIRQVQYKRVVRYRTRKQRPPGEGPPRRQRGTPGAEGEGRRRRRKQGAGSWKVARKQRQAMQHLEQVLHGPHGSAAEEEDWEEVEHEGAAAAWAAAGHWSSAGSKGSRGRGSAAKLSAFAAHATAAAWQAAAGLQLGPLAGPAALPDTAAHSSAAQGAAGTSATTAAPATQQQLVAELGSTTSSMIAGPPLPVAKAMELLVTLLYMSQHKGNSGGLSATALTCRFTSDVIVAAFKWAKALGWVQMGTANKPLALSRTWLRQAHRDPTITRLLVAGATAEADLTQQLQQAATASTAPQQQQGGGAEAGHSTPLFQRSSSGFLVGPVGRGALLLQLLHQAFLGTLRLSLCQERPPEDREGPVLLAASPQAVRVVAAVPGPEEAAPLVVVRDAGVLPGALLEDLAHLLVYTRQAHDSPAALAAALGGLEPPAAASSAVSAAAHPAPTAPEWQAVAAAVAGAAGHLVFAACDVARDVAVRQAAEAACWASLQQGTSGEAAVRSLSAAQDVLQQVRAAGGAGTSTAHLWTQQVDQDAGSTADVAQRIATAIQQLRAYGLVRVVAGWRALLLVASEVSQELLAFPPPAASPAAAPGATTTAGQQQQQQEEEAGEVLVTTGPTSSSRSSQGSGREALLAPWLDPVGRVVPELWQGLVARAVGAVLRSPGIPEPLLMQQLDFISPGSAAALLEALVEQGMLLVKSLALPSPPAFVVRRTVEAVGASAGLTGAAPPSFLCKRRGATAGAPGSQPSVVRHYWPSLEHSWSAPAQAQPPVQVVGGLPAANPVGTRIADVEMHDV